MLQRVQLKGVLILFPVFFLFGTFFTASLFAENSNGVTILYTGSVRGALDPIQL